MIADNQYKNKYNTSRGHPWPFGASFTRTGVNFAIVSESAKNLTLNLYREFMEEPIASFALDHHINRTGDVWHILIHDLEPGIHYNFFIVNEDNSGLFLLDPYSKINCGAKTWGHPLNIIRENHKIPYRLSTVVDNNFNWEDDRLLNIPLKDTIIYELHVRGFTQHPTSGVQNPGTFKGLTEKISYLKDLGITAIELMPVTDFDETGIDRINPVNGEKLLNFWGYDPISFFALKSSYASKPEAQQSVNEFKEMVKAFHKAGIEVILDIVFNHTAEGNEHGPVYNLKGLDRNTYYMYDEEQQHYLNYSGCGNTVNCNHPVVRSMIIDALRYWVMEMHVDGFRFDLASILSRGPHGEVLSNPPVLERIALDPVLANTKIIAEAWDASGLYQVGDFPHWQRWMEWNGKFRDDVRQFIKGDPGKVPYLAKRLSGSSDLYEDDGREPFHSVNFIDCHDGFTLADLVMYNQKHNLANGEKNNDGDSNNHSYNYGIEGPTSDKKISQLRIRQIKNMAAILMLSQGVPMFYAGDEFGRSQGGNNNAYCQDNETGWVDWSLTEKNRELLYFFKMLITFRKEHSNLRRTQFKVETVNGIPEMTWHSTKVAKPDWTENAKTLGLFLAENNRPGHEDSDIYIMINGDTRAHKFDLPHLIRGKKWVLVFDTYSTISEGIFDLSKAPLLSIQNKYALNCKSIAVFVSVE